MRVSLPDREQNCAPKPFECQKHRTGVRSSNADPQPSKRFSTRVKSLSRLRKGGLQRSVLRRATALSRHGFASEVWVVARFGLSPCLFVQSPKSNVQIRDFLNKVRGSCQHV